MKKLFYLLLLISGLSVHKVQAQLSIRVVKDSLFIPWEIIYGPDGNIWFDQKNGYVCKLDPVTGVTDTIYHEANTVINGEGGMVGMALHPSFPDSAYIYIAYEYKPDVNHYYERVARYTYNGSTLVNQIVLLDSITGASYHNGCRLLIVNDKLFITTGDATVGSNAQDLLSNNGKILRINLDGSIPADNPIANSPIWCWGQRNAQGMVYANNILYSSMHGNTTDDEINIIVKGRNYGWPTVEGYCDQPAEMTFCTDSNVKEPIFAWTPTVATCGIDYYNLNMFPAWQNSLLLCTLKDTSLHQLKLNATHDSILSDTRVFVHNGRLRDICIAPNGKIYLSTSNSNAADNGIHTDRIIELYDSATAVREINTANALNIYPNPAKEQITVKLNSIGRSEYEIINPVGQTMLRGSVNGNTANISISSIPKGVYYIRLVAESGQISSGKIMKE